MMSHTNDRAILKSYLLGEVTDEEQLRQIEERVFADEEYYQELLRVEAELVDQYASGKLTAGEREKAETLFLSTRDRHRDLGFALAVKEYLSKKSGRTQGPSPQTGGAGGGGPKPLPNNVKKFPGGKRILSSALLKIAASVLIVFTLGAGVWRTFFYHSDVDRGLVTLKEAYKDQRPTEARISVLDYAPPPAQRGIPAKVNSDARGRAERFLQYAVTDTPDAASYHAFGDQFLAAGQFDDALAQFDKASKLDPNNAKLHNDIGVALFEKSRAARADDESGKDLIDAGNSLEHFDKALELDGALLDALFNRALALESLQSFEQAREAWTKYLEKDSTSGWAEEARRHLGRLNERRQGKSSQNKEQILNEFLAAYKLGDDERAWQVISRNRETITGKLVSAQLINSYLNSALNGHSTDARDTLQALKYAGKLESKKADDNYTADLARYYGLSPPARLATLTRAHELMQQGYEWCQQSKFGEAAGAFEKARSVFESAGDEPEIYFSEYWIGYCYYQLTHSDESLTILRSLALACEKIGYKWLLAQALNMSANVETVLKDYSKAIADTEQSLTLSEQLNDSYTEQKNLAQQADKYRMLNNYPQMLRYLRRCLERSSAEWPGARQMWRNYDTATNTFFALGLNSAALAYGKEALRLSVEELKDPSTTYVSLTHMGLVFGRLHNQEEGIRLAGQGLAIGQELSNTAIGQKIIAYCELQLGDLYRQSGDFTRAVESYERAIQIYDRLKFEIFSYDAHKGKLLCHIALGDDAASRSEIQAALELVEKNRKTIREEGNRNTYYDAEQAIYDLAVDFAYTRSNDPQRAFEYSEESRARTLLDLMHRQSQQPDNGEGLGHREESITVRAVTPPLTLAEIQRRMPERVQILQYTILPDKVIIWLIRKDSFEAREKRVTVNELDKLIRRYLDLISSPPNGRDGETQDAAVALYDILVKPVESLLDEEKTLCVVPDKILNHLPFGSLVSPITGRYLVADHLMIFSPSSSVFVSGSEAARAKASEGTESLLSVGDPTFDREAFPQLQALPAARKEAEEVAEYYDSKTCLVGPAATKEGVTRHLDEVDIAHFASHYIVDEDSSMSSKLLLAKSGGAGEAKEADSVLKVDDLYRMKLRRTRLVILAACQTGVERYYGGEGMIGMSRAFIAAGVPTVVASQWPVDSDATAELMVSFHRHRKRDGVSTAEALRRAQLDFLNQEGRHYQHPYFWAAFVLVGGYTPS